MSDFIASFNRALNCDREEIQSAAINKLQEINKQIEVPYGNFKKN